MNGGEGVVTGVIDTEAMIARIGRFAQGKPQGERLLLLCIQIDVELIGLVRFEMGVNSGVTQAREIARLKMERQMEVVKASSVYDGAFPLDLSGWEQCALQEKFKDRWLAQWEHWCSKELYEGPCHELH